jgi:hypothetical protein
MTENYAKFNLPLKILTSIFSVGFLLLVTGCSTLGENGTEQNTNDRSQEIVYDVDEFAVLIETIESLENSIEEARVKGIVESRELPDGTLGIYSMLPNFVKPAYMGEFSDTLEVVDKEDLTLWVTSKLFYYTFNQTVDNVENWLPYEFDVVEELTTETKTVFVLESNLIVEITYYPNGSVESISYDNGEGEIKSYISYYAIIDKEMIEQLEEIAESIIG